MPSLNDIENAILKTPDVKRLILEVFVKTNLSRILVLEGVVNEQFWERLQVAKVPGQDQIMQILQQLPNNLSSLNQLVAIFGRHASTKPYADKLHLVLGSTRFRDPPQKSQGTNRRAPAPLTTRKYSEPVHPTRRCLSALDHAKLHHLAPTLANDGDAHELMAALCGVVFDQKDKEQIFAQVTSGEKIIKLIELYIEKGVNLDPLRKAFEYSAQPHLTDELDKYKPPQKQFRHQISAPTRSSYYQPTEFAGTVHISLPYQAPTKPVIQPKKSWHQEKSRSTMCREQAMVTEWPQYQNPVENVSFKHQMDDLYEEVTLQVPQNIRTLVRSDTETTDSSVKDLPPFVPVQDHLDTKTREIAKTLKSGYMDEFSTFKPLAFAEQIFEMDKIWVNLEMQNVASWECQSSDCMECLKMAFNKKKVVICKGDPGAGKTTLCNYLCYQWAQEIWTDFDLILVARLRDISQVGTILDAALLWLTDYDIIDEEEADYLRKTVVAHCRVQKQKTLVILDGLDEAPQVCRELDRLLADKKKRVFFNLLITSRPWAVTTHYPAQIVKIELLTQKQQKEYITKHFAGNPRKGRSLIRKLSRNKVLQELAQVSLMLSHICFYYANNEELEADSLGSMYWLLTEYLIERYQEDKLGGEQPFGDQWACSSIIRSLGLMALSGLNTGMVTPNKLVFCQADLAKFSINEKVCVDSGLLIKDWHKKSGHSCPQACYSYAHRTSQEFFAALFVILAYRRMDSQKLTPSSVGNMILAYADEQLIEVKKNLSQSDWNTWTIFHSVFGVALASGRSDFIDSAVTAFLDIWKPTQVADIHNYELIKPKLMDKMSNPYVKKLFMHCIHQSIEVYVGQRSVDNISYDRVLYDPIPLACLSNFNVQRIGHTNCFYLPTLQIIVPSKCRMNCTHILPNKLSSVLKTVRIFAPEDLNAVFKNSAFKVVSIKWLDLIIGVPGCGVLELKSSTADSDMIPPSGEEFPKKVHIERLQVEREAAFAVVTSLSTLVERPVQKLTANNFFWLKSHGLDFKELTTHFLYLTRLRCWNWSSCTGSLHVLFGFALPRMTHVHHIEFQQCPMRSDELEKLQFAFRAMPWLETVAWGDKTFDDADKLVQWIEESGYCIDPEEEDPDDPILDESDSDFD